MKKIFLFLILSLTFLFIQGKESNKTKYMVMDIDSLYTNGEITVNFKGSYSIDKIKSYIVNGYFSTSTEHIRFYEIKPQPEYVQQVNSEDGFLCSMYILPKIDLNELEKEIEEQFNTKRNLSSYRGISKFTVSQIKVLKWRYQTGKSRMDHYMIFGAKFNYLFISSPYGSNGYIENILANVKFKE